MPNYVPGAAGQASSGTQKFKRIVGAALLLAGWLTLSNSTTAQAGDSGVVGADYVSGAADQTYVRAVGYSSPEAAEKLKWMPVRPTKDQVGVRQVVAIGEQGPAFSAAEPIPLGPATKVRDAADPFNDPFGDAEALRTPPGTLPISQGGRSADSLTPFQGDLPDLLRPDSSDESRPLDVPSLEEALAASPEVADGECPTPESLKRIKEITYDITAKKGRFPRECGIEIGTFQPRCWTPLTFNWKASGLCHKPLYFEGVQVERYGHSWGPYLQPVVSGAHFFLSVPLLPYQMGLYPPGECIYSLGYYRPGNCTPYLLDPLPISVRAGLVQAGVYTGLVAAIP